jgi:hypothetical protein
MRPRSKPTRENTQEIHSDCSSFFGLDTALAGGQTKLLGAPDDTWQGSSNKEDTQRRLVVTCPEDTAPARVALEPDAQGAVIVVECDYTE